MSPSALFHNYDSNPGALGYTFTGTNSSWGFTNNVSLSPPTSLTDSPAGNYLNNTNSFATGPIFSTVGRRGCRLVGSIRLATELGYDVFLLDISRDGGATWTTSGTASQARQAVHSSPFHFRTFPIEVRITGSASTSFRTVAMLTTADISTMWGSSVRPALRLERPIINFFTARRWRRLM